VEPVPDDLQLAPPEALDFAQRLLDEGRPFSAHEVLEAVWKSAPDTERELWRGLAQLAVGRTHLERGNPRGARALLRRGGSALEAYRGSTPYGIAVDRLIEESAALADRVSASRPEPSIPPMVLRNAPPSNRTDAPAARRRHRAGREREGS
jgi:predicted metal-dependent hydrolase